MDRVIRIGGACGFWGESAMATPQLLADGGIDYLVYDYLAEITMSIMARARAKDAESGYATDFLSAALAPNLEAIAAQGVKILSNAGGVNLAACGRAIEALLASKGIELKVAVVTGDDLMDARDALAGTGITEMFSGAAFPPARSIASVNAYLGAAPIVAALAAGADIVVTGRCADSALALAACRHAFSWDDADLDLQAAGSLVGHLLECGPQATGGNFTDWHDVADSLATIGYPIAEVRADGRCIITKPAGTGGAVTPATVAEQLVYEIEDPQSYVLPDVVADFANVTLSQEGPDRVAVAGARGRPPPECYKVSTTWMDGYRGGMLLSFVGDDAEARARAFARAALTRVESLLKAAGAPSLTETSVEVIGTEEHYGQFRRQLEGREVVLKLAARHPAAAGIGGFIKAITGLALAAPAGLSIFNAGRPRPSPVVRLFSFLVARETAPAQVALGGEVIAIPPPAVSVDDDRRLERPASPAVPVADTGVELVEVPLLRLAWARSGDKGNRANIGVIARNPALLPWLWQGLGVEIVAERFAHFLEGPVERFLLPGPAAINFVLHDVLGGGGVASLRADPQGKSYAQILLATPISVPANLVP